MTLIFIVYVHRIYWISEYIILSYRQIMRESANQDLMSINFNTVLQVQY
jgi:hypothetical protein